MSQVVSVIVPTHNRRQALVPCIESILKQRFRGFELIIIDDGSADGSVEEVLQRWIDSVENPDEAALFIHNPRERRQFCFCVNGVPVSYYYQRNRGFSTACNRALRKARGSLVSVTDPDVVWAPERLARQVQYFHSHRGVYISVSGHIPMRNQQPLKKPVLPGPGGWLFEDIIRERALSYNTALIHRRCLEIIGGFDENLPQCENYDLWVRLTAHFPVHALEQPLVQIPRRTPDAKTAWGTHRFRVYALEKAFQSGYLNAEYRRLVAEQVVFNCEKLVQGFKARDNMERANFYERKRKKFASEVRKLHATRPRVLEAAALRD
ncbi:MAG: glycosyltransferase [Candidatus Eisenbacteria bacterium]|nr:glycosyltransferase [Candidatus Eisenbacteria bacterium]